MLGLLWYCVPLAESGKYNAAVAVLHKLATAMFELVSNEDKDENQDRDEGKGQFTFCNPVHDQGN